MSAQVPTSDAGLLALLRISGPLRVSELVDAMEVTATAVRQRLVRLLAQNSIQREATWHGVGRPRHRYWLTEKGLELTGSTFIDLAAKLWQERCQSHDPELCRDTLRRIARGWHPAVRTRFPARRPPSKWSRWPGCSNSSRFAFWHWLPIRTTNLWGKKL